MCPPATEPPEPAAPGPPPGPSNGEIAHALQLLGDLLELQGADRHRVLAYRRGAARVRAHPESVAALARAGRATALPDIGATLQAKIAELAETGTIAALDRVRGEVPEGLVEVARIEGIGPKRAMALHAHLGVADLPSLRAAAEAGSVRAVPGLGPKTAAAIVDRLTRTGDGDAPAERISMGVALPLAEDVARWLEGDPAVVSAHVAGSLRRGRETVHDVDIVVSSADPGAVFARLAECPLVQPGMTGGDNRRAVVAHTGLRMDVSVAPPGRLGNLLQHATGSAAHNVRLRELAVRRGMSMSEYGVTMPDGTVVTSPDEEGVYATLGLGWIPPELREDRDELERAAGGEPFPRLVSLADIRGQVHVHSTWSDGHASIARMAAAAREHGHEYLGISDHSRSLVLTGGLDPDRVRRQWEEIDRLNEDPATGIRILRCTEMDILADGRLDFDDELLAGFDVVVASLHSALGRPAAEVTARLLAAVECPHVDAIGHPTGRMLGRRGHSAVDLERVVARAAETGTLLEINGQPRRLDLDSDMARLAREAGVRLLLSSDAHSPEALGYLRFAVMVARRAGATAADVANTGPWEGLRRPAA